MRYKTYKSLFTGITFLAIQLSGNALLSAKASPDKNIPLTICKIIDDKEGSYAFIYENHSQKTSKYFPFKISGNNLFLNFQKNNELICLGSHADFRRMPVFPAMTKVIWFDNIEFSSSFPYKWPYRFTSLCWFFRQGRKDYRNYIFLWKPAKGEIDFKNILDKKDSINFKLAKVFDGKPLSFALIVSNDTQKQVSIPNYFSKENTISLKFPDGKFLSHLIEVNQGHPLQLLPRQSIYLIFDISEFLKRSKKFSLKSFNYGISEFQWRVILPDNKVITKTIKLLKIEKPLPEKARHHGIWMDIKKPLR